MTNKTPLDFDIDRFAVRRGGSLETYAIYFAYAETHHGHGLMKVGVTVEPYRRLYEVYQGCPFPIITFVWGWVGCKAHAYQFETAMKRGLKEEGRHLRGEWFHWDIPATENFEGGRLAEVRHDLKRRAGGLTVEWKDGDIDEVIAFNNMRAKPKPKPAKRKPFWKG